MFRFVKLLNNKWIYVPLHIPLELRSINNLIERMKDYSFPSFHILNSKYSNYYFCCDLNPEDYVCIIYPTSIIIFNVFFLEIRTNIF